MDFEEASGERIATLNKRGENVIYIRFRRASGVGKGGSGGGLLVSAKTVPAVEDLFRSWGTGEASGVEVWGREWAVVGDEPLRAYDLVHDPGAVPIDAHGRVHYILNAVGRPILREESGLSLVNLSFLRCEGISGAGVSFICKGVYSDEAVAALAKNIQQAALSFYRSYLKPIDLAVVVSTQEIKP